MSAVRSFNDTSSVSLAYALSGVTTAAELAAVPFTYLPFTTEGFSMSKSSVKSTAIRGNRRSIGAKNTSGSVAGAATVEFGAVGFVLDMLQLTMMNTWKDISATDPLLGKYITDGKALQFMAVEKTTKAGATSTDMQFHERFYGVAMNDATLDLSDSSLMTMAMSFIGMFADTAKAVQGVTGLGGSMAVTGKTLPEDYEIADSSNNLKNLIVTDKSGVPLQVTFSSANLKIQNNVREQKGLGSVFASGVGLGKVDVELSGDMYYYDQTMLDVHMNNERVKASMTIETPEGTFTLQLPNLAAQSPTNNAQGENQDYKTSITLAAEEGSVTIGTDTVACTIAITYVPKP